MLKKYLALPLRLNTYAMALERIILQKKFHTSSGQLFILGLPRSGTTLIYQYIATRLKVAYFTNGVGRFPGAPCLTSFIQHNLYGQYCSDFKSNYGKVKGYNAPREAGGFWNRFFDTDQYGAMSDLSEKEIALLRNTVACVSNIFGDAPFVNKNVKHLLRINILRDIFPDSKFLIIYRNMEDIALSLLRGRYKNLSDPRQWWSVRPPNYPDIKDLPIVEQIAHQCLSLMHKMKDDLLKIPPDRIMYIHYGDFCKNPEQLISMLEISLKTKVTTNPPRTSFPIIRNRAENQEEELLLHALRVKDLQPGE